MDADLNQKAPPSMGRRAGRSAAAWVLLLLFLFQGAAGALHHLEYHRGPHLFGHPDHRLHPSPSPLPALQAAPGALHPDHDPAHCSICHHLLSNPFALLGAAIPFVSFQTTSATIGPSRSPLAAPPAFGRRPRAPPSLLLPLD